jgi:hypothetical protein
MQNLLLQCQQYMTLTHAVCVHTRLLQAQLREWEAAEAAEAACLLLQCW